MVCVLLLVYRVGMKNSLWGSLFWVMADYSRDYSREHIQSSWTRVLTGM
jgi:hypothetical protein